MFVFKLRWSCCVACRLMVLDLVVVWLLGLRLGCCFLGLCWVVVFARYVFGLCWVAGYFWFVGV